MKSGKVNRKVMIGCLFIMGVSLIVSVFIGCGEKIPKTAEETFLKFTHAALRTREKEMKKYATEEYLKNLESVFDMIVISAMWPALVNVEDSKANENQAVLKVNGVDRKKNTVYGIFELKKIDNQWKVSEGNWWYNIDNTPVGASEVNKAFEEQANNLNLR